MTDELAKAIADEFYMRTWDELRGRQKPIARDAARAALSWLGFPEDAEVKEGCVGEAIKDIERTLRASGDNLLDLCSTYRTCLEYVLGELRALGQSEEGRDG
jgi:hypothetical protein